VTGLTPQVVTVTQSGQTNKTLNLTVFLEALYNNGTGLMHPAMDASGPHWGATIADKITVEFHNSSSYSTLVYTASNVTLNTNGTATITFPATYSGYYITVIHRNSILTVSSSPVSFSGSTTSYSFNNSTKAYGGNMLHKSDGTWVIYAGDDNQDGLVDSSDMILVDNDATNFAVGYISTDINGDGLIDSSDMVILDNNATAFVSKVTP
jgi:hypothetical protein